MTYLTQSVHRNAQIRGNSVATVFGARQRTWGEVKDRIARFAGALKSLVVTKGDRVAILAFNSDRYFEYYFAIPWAGACLVPLNIRWAPSEIAYALKDSGAKILLVDDAFVEIIPLLRTLGVPLTSIVFIGDKKLPDGMLSYEQLLKTHQPVLDAYCGNDDLAGIFYTGGTTGFPKGVMLSHINLWAIAICMPSLIKIDENSRILHTGPMFHMADIMMTNGGMVVGAMHVFLPKFSSSEVIQITAKNKITHTSIVPLMLQNIVNDKALQEADMSSLEFVLYGGSSITEAVLKKALHALPSTQFAQGYGQTELAPLATLLQPKYHVTKGPNAGKLKSAGQAIPCAEIQIVDTKGKELPLGDIGEIIVKGPQTMKGYWRKPQATTAILKNGWVFTGDMGYMDKEGFIYIVDRLKDMIITGGENVYSAEVENAMSHHPSIGQVVVFGIPSDQWGEKVHAEVILKEGESATEIDIINKTKEYLANYKCPKNITFRTLPFPVSGAGKLLKQEVKRPYWEKTESANNKRKAINKQYQGAQQPST